MDEKEEFCMLMGSPGLAQGLFLTKRFCAEDKKNSVFYDRGGLALAVASGVVTQETTLEDSTCNDTVSSLQSLSPSVLQPFERSELRMKTATGYAVEHSPNSLSPFVRLAGSPTTGASPAGNGCREDSNAPCPWLE